MRERPGGLRPPISNTGQRRAIERRARVEMEVPLAINIRVKSDPVLLSATTTNNEGMTLTIAEIKDLAEFAGLVIHEDFLPDEDDFKDEITISECPKHGVEDEDRDAPLHYAHIAYLTEYPEEGVCGLGPEISKG